MNKLTFLQMFNFSGSPPDSPPGVPWFNFTVQNSDSESWGSDTPPGSPFLDDDRHSLVPTCDPEPELNGAVYVIAWDVQFENDRWGFKGPDVFLIDNRGLMYRWTHKAGPIMFMIGWTQGPDNLPRRGWKARPQEDLMFFLPENLVKILNAAQWGGKHGFPLEYIVDDAVANAWGEIVGLVNQYEAFPVPE